MDYVFTDPPFGDNLAYAELNFLIEAWHRVFTNWKPEAIMSDTQKKTLTEYQDLSDPPYYTACPNPFLGDFIKRVSKPFDPSIPYHSEPLAVDSSEGKTDSIYTAHSYHTKVPHKSIMRARAEFHSVTKMCGPISTRSSLMAR